MFLLQIIYGTNAFYFVIEFVMQYVGTGKANLAMNLFVGDKTKQQQNSYKEIFTRRVRTQTNLCDYQSL